MSTAVNDAKVQSGAFVKTGPAQETYLNHDNSIASWFR
jgi:hypothetical protein